MLAVSLDVLIVNRYVTLEAVGAYALAASIASKASVVNHSLYTVLLPGVAQLPDRSAVRSYLTQSMRRSAVVALGLAVCIPLAQPASHRSRIGPDCETTRFDRRWKANRRRSHYGHGSIPASRGRRQ